jgi:hypothetical protein
MANKKVPAFWPGLYILIVLVSFQSQYVPGPLSKVEVKIKAKSGICY